MANTRTHVAMISRARTLDPLGCTRAMRSWIGAGGRRVGTDEKESRRKATGRRDVRRVYKEQEGRNEGRGNGSQRRGIGEGGGAFRRSEKKKKKRGSRDAARNAMRGDKKKWVPRRDRAAEIIRRRGKKGTGGSKNRKGKKKGGGKKRGTRGNFECRDNVRYVYALCQRGGKREGKRARSGSGSELWQHMRARDSHGAPFVRVSATQLVTVCIRV